jgi:hypothetical protein
MRLLSWEQKEEVHREATRLTAMQHREGVTLPYGARKVALDMGPGEKNKVQGFRESPEQTAECAIDQKELTDCDAYSGSCSSRCTARAGYERSDRHCRSVQGAASVCVFSFRRRLRALSTFTHAYTVFHFINSCFSFY